MQIKFIESAWWYFRTELKLLIYKYGPMLIIPLLRVSCVPTITWWEYIIMHTHKKEREKKMQRKINGSISLRPKTVISWILICNFVQSYQRFFIFIYKNKKYQKKFLKWFIFQDIWWPSQESIRLNSFSYEC